MVRWVCCSKPARVATFQRRVAESKACDSLKLKRDDKSELTHQNRLRLSDIVLRLHTAELLS